MGEIINISSNHPLANPDSEASLCFHELGPGAKGVVVRAFTYTLNSDLRPGSFFVEGLKQGLAQAVARRPNDWSVLQRIRAELPGDQRMAWITEDREAAAKVDLRSHCLPSPIAPRCRQDLFPNALTPTVDDRRTASTIVALGSEWDVPGNLAAIFDARSAAGVADTLELLEASGKAMSSATAASLSTIKQLLMQFAEDAPGYAPRVRASIERLERELDTVNVLIDQIAETTQIAPLIPLLSQLRAALSDRGECLSDLPVGRHRVSSAVERALAQEPPLPLRTAIKRIMAGLLCTAVQAELKLNIEVITTNSAAADLVHLSTRLIELLREEKVNARDYLDQLKRVGSLLESAHRQPDISAAVARNLEACIGDLQALVASTAPE